MAWRTQAQSTHHNHPRANVQVALQAVQAVMMMTAALLDDQALLDQANAAHMAVRAGWELGLFSCLLAGCLGYECHM